ncbi:MFS transporter [Pelagicoccus sp. SDUM812002]|uniref:MFS transporter n=1 Tax=Pelagicoccus sp. SDUM812002 TaxID=3041266 RepID=UPI00280EA012|nr:MFS transporter [Pelagicoccus sp. SDUM812002]MDQ8186735.1 MFS transporter [Pelagicoccus sp. SDUM812002]
MSIHAPLSSSYRLIVTQGLNAFGDHAAKITASALVAATFAERQAAVWVGVVSALYVLPYIFLAPLAGTLTNRYSKVAVVRGSLLLQTTAMTALSVSALLQSFAGVLVSLAAVACQSSFLAPSRNALLKDLCGSARIGQMMGLLGLAGVSATLAGLALGGWSFDKFWGVLGSPWSAAAVVGLVSAAISALAYVVVSGIRPSSEGKREAGERFLAVAKEVLSRPVLRWSSLGLAWFYAVGALLVMVLLQDSRWDHGQEIGSASQGGLMAALLGLGVAIGSGFAAYLCRKHIEVGLSFVGALMLAVLVPATALLWQFGPWATACIFLLGVSGGLFSAPLNALFVASARDEVRVGSIAANNLFINLMSGAFVGLGSLMGYLAWSPEAQLWVVAVTAVLVVGFMAVLIPESLVRVTLLGIAKVFYPMRLKGLENMPQSGGVLVVSNHVSYADALLIFLASPRPVRFMGTDEMLRFPLMRWAYRKFNVIAVSPKSAKEAVAKSVKALDAGDVVCIFPEGALTRTGMIMPFKKGAELMARLSGAAVLPASIDGMWGSVLSFSDKPFRYSRGMPMRRPVSVSFGEALSGDAATAPAMQDAVEALEHEAFSARFELNENLGALVLKKLKKNPFALGLVDRGLGALKVRNFTLLGLGLGFARLIGKTDTARRVGILLPPGLPGFAANLGALWSGKSSVNLNPTVSSDAFGTMIEESGVRTVLTSRKALVRFKDLGFSSVKLVFVEDVMPLMRGVRLLLDALIWTVFPYRALRRLYSIRYSGGDREAALLFSSGSSAAPKGIPLSHRNLVANATQLSECYLMRFTDRLLANLPLYHSFGLTGGMWLPLLKGMRIVATPSPLQPKENVAAIREESVSVMLGTPTFLRAYLKRATAVDLASLRVTFAGAEKLPADLALEWESRFVGPILEGYGLTECSPVLSANCLQSREMLGRYALSQVGYKAGTAGRPLPGVWIRIVSENDVSKQKGRGESGLILAKGPNIFRGYLDPHEESCFVQDGWFDTGDIGRLDEDGCLVIEGRLSRFSKIAGEMVSHAKVESEIAALYPDLQCFVGARECARKGESLILLATGVAKLGDLAKRLRERGMPNLWIPQEVVEIPVLPQLGTGKLDLKRCKQLCLGSAARAVAGCVSS